MSNFTCRSCPEDLTERVRAALDSGVTDFHLLPSGNHNSRPFVVVDVVCNQGHANTFRLIRTPPA